ncbi:hypothetical protein J4409_01300 [Candidatus Woesearchaeota archaeon]|nr:hypothetical protein [Candidatus Woesearchaeota archaeon]
MKRSIFILFFVLLTSLNIIYAIESVISHEELRFDFKKTDPSPLGPGKIFDVYFDITNLQSYTIRNVQINIVDLFPFYSLDENKTSILMDEIRPGEKKSIKYAVGINKDIDEGTYQLSLQYYSNRIGAIVSKDFNLDIKRVGVVVAPTNIRLEPERIRPGGTAKLEVDIANTVSYTITDVAAELILDGTPFVTLGETSEKKIRQLAPNTKVTLDFNLILNPDAELKVYRVPLLITYFDNLGSKNVRNNTVGITVYAKPEYNVDLENSNIFTKGQSGEITISIANKGNSELKFLNIEILESDDYKIISNPDVYVGNLESDDFETATYKIYTETSKPAKLRFKIGYKDTYNKDFSDDVEINLPLYSKWTAQNLGLVQRNMSWVYFIIAILVVLFIYKTYKIWKFERDVENSIKILFKNMFKYAKEEIFRIKKR